MVREVKKEIEVVGHYESVFTYTVLKKCKKCEGVHPLARTPPIVSKVCPDCGTKLPKAKTITV